MNANIIYTIFFFILPIRKSALLPLKIKMKESYKSFDELPMMLSVSQVAKVLGISRTRSYELVNEKGFPKIKIGTRIVVPKDEFKLWIQKQIKKG